MRRHWMWLMLTVLITSVLMVGCTSSTTTEPSTESTKEAITTPTEVDNEVPKATDQDEQAALQTAKDYKATEFEVNENDEKSATTKESALARGELIKPFLTEKYFEKQMADRNIVLPLMVAYKEQVKLRGENMNFTLKENRGDSLLVSYTLDLIFIDDQGKEVRNIPLEGELTFLFENKQWLIVDDTYNIRELQELVYDYGN
ncbi:hypothetical protein ASD24_19445 [Paenibacillus sp. Root52]|uniref:hypothetical protein n=1 Tax=Paenibacillus sp. Root52 TaxID=1736552 RepID=UPI0006F2F29A|nr:hypothetical protein [Paenibacillus sp. Root52]KQY79516.1 hypothetical protein ASD24_19445 [Paenibacillus sp. Root52]